MAFFWGMGSEGRRHCVAESLRSRYSCGSTKPVKTQE
jgi:hypothetical protein